MTEAKRARHREYMRRRYQTDPLHRIKQQARNAVGRALKAGKITREPCDECRSLLSEAHHEDYGKPLEIVWLCRKCHEERHGGAGCHGSTPSKDRQHATSCESLAAATDLVAGVGR